MLADFFAPVTVKFPGEGGGGGGGGIPYQRDGDARRLSYGCKLRILVSLRVFWAKCYYF